MATLVHGDVLLVFSAEQENQKQQLSSALNKTPPAANFPWWCLCV
jgi:hypothetical protein